MPVQERAGDRAHDDARRDPGERDETGERRRVVLVQREEDERNSDHRLGDAGDLHPEQGPAEVWHTEQGAIGRDGGLWFHGPAIVSEDPGVQ